MKRKVSTEEEEKKEKKERREGREKRRKRGSQARGRVSQVSASRVPKEAFGSHRAERSGPRPVPRLQACSARHLARRQPAFGSGKGETGLSARSRPTAHYFSNFLPPRTTTRKFSINSYYFKKNLLHKVPYLYFPFLANYPGCTETYTV